MLFVVSSLEGSTSAIMESWNKNTLPCRMAENSLLSLARTSLSVASLENSTKPIFVNGFLPSPPVAVLRTLTGSRTV